MACTKPGGEGVKIQLLTTLILKSRGDHKQQTDVQYIICHDLDFTLQANILYNKASFFLLIPTSLSEAFVRVLSH